MPKTPKTAKKAAADAAGLEQDLQQATASAKNLSIEEALEPLQLFNVTADAWVQFTEAEATFDFELGLDVSHIELKHLRELTAVFRKFVLG